MPDTKFAQFTDSTDFTELVGLDGGRDVAYFTGSANVIIKENNYVYWQVVNLTDDADCTLENASSYSIKER